MTNQQTFLFVDKCFSIRGSYCLTTWIVVSDTLIKFVNIIDSLLHLLSTRISHFLNEKYQVIKLRPFKIKAYNFM